MVEEIIKLVNRAETREALAKCWEFIVFSAHAVLNDEDGEYGDKTEAEAIDLAFDVSGYPYEPLGVMRQEVLEKTRPHIITAEELTDALFSLLPRDRHDWMDEDAFESVYPAFLNRVRSLLTHRVSRPFAIAQLPVRPGSDRSEAVAGAFVAGMHAASPSGKDEPVVEEALQAIQALSHESRFKIWSGNGISVGLCGTGRPDIDLEFATKNVSGDPPLLYATLWGWISPDAMTLLAEELRVVLRSLVSSSFVAAEAEQFEGWSPLRPTGLPVVGVELVTREASFVRMCLDSYFAKPTSKKDLLDRRIRNAVTMLVEADGQANHAVGIALAVTAIEALLGSGKTEIAAALCDGVATLLEPDLKQRSAANEFMKKVYDDRSRVLHGERIAAPEQRRKDIRLLAGGVLYAVVNRVDCLRRSGYDPQTPEELRKEIKDLKYSPGQPMGVPELPRVWSLWRERGQKTP